MYASAFTIGKKGKVQVYAVENLEFYPKLQVAFLLHIYLQKPHHFRGFCPVLLTER